MHKHRIHELASELGLSSRTVLEVASTAGVYAKSASSPLDDAEAAVVRARCRARGLIGTNPGTRRATQQPRSMPGPLAPNAQPRRKRWRGELAPLTQVMLSLIVLPARRDPYTLRADEGAPWLDEVEKAQKLADDWAGMWFDHTEAEAWLEAHDHRMPPHLAASLRAAGLSPTDAAVRLWYGKVKSDRPTLAAQVGCGDMTPQEAAAALKAAGLAG